MASGISAASLKNTLQQADGAIDWNAAASNWRGALYTATGVTAWDFATTLAYTTDNEHPSTGNYSAGGDEPDAAGAFTEYTSSGSVFLSWDIGDFSWTSATLANVRGILIYKYESPGTKPGAVGIDFGQDYQVTNGTFGVQWAAPGANGGVFYINLTPTP